ncbi:ABC transporter ATP-binding protein [Flaviflexus salsibiostraticola]|uniref:ABC transporter ATP-binding protein n=1 Tax=Flaviflexus salsibiostraticola TaxID=1282737 RepID=A0A3S8Z687_9ACTO|nr:ABC transporter ATP-binding protein [Flaviflexus salsibiostraticola]AZN28995.1 ABC transporter ATP-binding protein [Flaviflexus salsibiostraticola]
MLIQLTWDYLRHRKGRVAAVLVLQLIQSIASLWLPALNAAIINDGVLEADIPVIWQLGGVMLGVTILQVIAISAAIYLGAGLAMGLGHHLRSEVFGKVQSFGRAELHRFGPASLITRSTNDVSQVQMVVHLTFTIIVMAPIMGVGGIVMAAAQDVVLSGLFVVIVPILGLFTFSMMVRLGPLYEVQQTRVDTINRLLREQLTGVRVIRAFLRQQAQKRRFRRANDDMREVWLKIGTTWAFMMPVIQMIVGLSSVAIVWFGGHRIDDGAMQVGSLIAFINYLMQILMAIMMAAMMFMMVPRARVSANRIGDVLHTDIDIVAPAEPTPLPPSPAEFRLDGATVQYDDADRPVLDSIDLRLPAGSTTALVGGTGSGKTTLVHMLSRMVDPVSGTVTLGGTDIRSFDPTSLRARIALVPQKAYLFAGTVASTVTGQRGALEFDEERIWRALDAAQATEFVAKLDDGLESRIDPGGRNLSGGQRQRLTIARALYRAMAGEVDLIIFDDSFSALDFATDKKLRHALPDAVPGVAVLIVAQRISTIRHADRIVVLDGGRDVGQGTHEELMESCSTYREIVASQLSAEEAA